MNCESCQKHISELIDNELSTNDSVKVFAHLSECQTCRLFFRSCMRMKESVQALSIDSLHEPEQEQTSWFRRYLRVPLPAAAVFILLLIAGLFGTSLNFLQDHDMTDVEQHQIIYISEHPEIEVRFMTDSDEQTL